MVEKKIEKKKVLYKDVLYSFFAENRKYAVSNANVKSIFSRGMAA